MRTNELAAGCCWWWQGWLRWFASSTRSHCALFWPEGGVTAARLRNLSLIIINNMPPTVIGTSARQTPPASIFETAFQHFTCNDDRSPSHPPPSPVKGKREHCAQRVRGFCRLLCGGEHQSFNQAAAADEWQLLEMRPTENHDNNVQDNSIAKICTYGWMDVFLAERRWSDELSCHNSKYITVAYMLSSLIGNAAKAPDMGLYILEEESQT